MRRALPLLAIVTAAACNGGLDFGAPADSAVYLGAITGTVYAPDGTRATSASVFLQMPNGELSSDYGGAFANGAGHFQIEATEGVYTLVAHQPGFAARVSGVAVIGGETRDIGDVHLAPCAPGNPCPAPEATPAPPPSFVIGELTADYTEVMRNYYPSSGYDEVYVRAQNFAQGIEVTLSFLDPTQFQAGSTYTLASTVFSALTYVPPSDPYASSYVAVSGDVTIDAWDLNGGGLVAIRLSNARYEWFDPYGGTNSPEYSATIESSSSLAGNVVVQGR